MATRFNIRTFIAMCICAIAQPIFAQLDVEISFKHYEENYQPLIKGDTIFGGDLEPWGGDGIDISIVPFDSPIIIEGFEDRPFEEIWVTNSGGSAFIHFDQDRQVETAMVLSGGLPILGYASALVDQTNSDQSYVILNESEDFILIEYKNVALLAEYTLGNGFLESRFNFQLEYRISDSRTRFLYGPSEITDEGANFIEEEFLITHFGFEESIYDDNGFWEDYLDVNHKVLVGLAEDPSIFVPQSVDNWPPIISLVNFPPKGTVYEFNIDTGTPTIDFEDAGIGWRVYPNPASKTLNLEFDENIDFVHEGYVRVYSMIGELLLHKSISAYKNLDIDFLSPGIYVVEVVSESYQGSKKFIKK